MLFISVIIKSITYLGIIVNNLEHITIANVPMTVGSKSMNTALGTCLPAPVSQKNVSKQLLSSPPDDLLKGISPSGWMPCSRQYSSQQAFPICTPDWPTCIDIHSR